MGGGGIMYKVCIFDLDGTLTDTLDSLVFSVNETMKEMGVAPITRDQCRMFVGNGVKVLLEKALQVNGEKAELRIDEAMQRYDRIFKVNCTYHVIPYDGIGNLIESLKAEGMKLAVLSNKPDRDAVSVVETIFGKGTFHWVQGQKEGIPRKPDPFAALQIAGELGAEPSEALYVGDSEVDIATGRAAGMTTIGVSWGFRGRESLKASGAGRIADTPDEIMEFVRQQ